MYLLVKNGNILVKRSLKTARSSSIELEHKVSLFAMDKQLSFSSDGKFCAIAGGNDNECWHLIEIPYQLQYRLLVGWCSDLVAIELTNCIYVLEWLRSLWRAHLLYVLYSESLYDLCIITLPCLPQPCFLTEQSYPRGMLSSSSANCLVSQWAVFSLYRRTRQIWDLVSGATQLGKGRIFIRWEIC